MAVRRTMVIGEYEAHKLEDNTIDIALYFCDTYLGKGLYNRSQLDTIVDLQHHYFYIIYDKEIPIGIFYCFVDRLEKVQEEFRVDIEGLCHIDESVGVCRSIALKESYRKTGLAEKLLDFFSNMLCAKEFIKVVFTLAWLNKDHIPASNHLARCGFSYYKKVDRPWIKYKELDCPGCGHKPCTCDGVLYYKQWKE